MNTNTESDHTEDVRISEMLRDDSNNSISLVTSWKQNLSTRISFAYFFSVACYVPLLSAPAFCIYKAFRATVNRQSPHHLLPVRQNPKTHDFEVKSQGQVL